MSEQENKMIEKKEEKKAVYRVTPRWYGELDRKNKQFNFEVHLPGVDKDKVTLKVLPELMHLEATREEESSKAIYTLTRYFSYEVDPDSIDAKCTNGLLKFSINIKDPLSDAVDIKL
jgi:HSP20 family molecular chaperone IbpA